MGLMRRLTQWRMITFRLKSACRHSLLICCVVLLTVLMLFSYVIRKKSPLQRQSHRSGTLISQNYRQVPHKHSPTREDRHSCKNLFLKPNTRWMLDQPELKVDCRRINPTPDSCHVADQLFSHGQPASCSHQPFFNFCHLESLSPGSWTVLCDKNASEVCDSPLSVGLVDQQSGALTWQEVGTSVQVSEKLTAMIVNSSQSRYYGFCFIRCVKTSECDSCRGQSVMATVNNNYEDYAVDTWNNEDGEDVYAEQLLILPPQFKDLHLQSQSDKDSEILNVNMILVDSVSHQHFFRSLPESVSVLENMNVKPNSDTVVFDFELVQAVRSRTFETLQMIFSGHVNTSEKPFGTQAIPPEPLKLSALLNKFKSQSYHTLWLEDLCYLWEWGISKDLHFLNKSSSAEETWRNMWKKLSMSQVDSIDVTLAMCKVLEANHIADHFHGPDAVCFNGQHQHEYLLEYLSLYQQTMALDKQPYFAFTMTNVGHEDSGRRIQTLDKALAKYLRLSSSLSNTLTVLFSDHGNAYGQFMDASTEAHIELFHPFLFLIIPSTVARILGNQVMQSLGVNSHRLVSFHDLHYTLNSIIDPAGLKIGATLRSRGLLEPVSASRTCHDIPRIMPNLCICQDFDTPVSNETNQNLFAYFAIARLNDEIQRQLWSWRSKNPTLSSRHGEDEDSHDGGTPPAFRNCEKLILFGIQNVRQNFQQDSSQVLKMELQVQQSQIFFVAVRVTFTSPGTAAAEHLATLEMYDRLSPYAKFSVCADDIDLSLCICDVNKSQFVSPVIPQLQHYRDLSVLTQFEVSVQSLHSDGDCVLLVTYRHDSGAVLFTANTCREPSFTLTISIEADRKFIYYLPSKQIHLLPGAMLLVGLVYSEKTLGWTCSVKVTCTAMSWHHINNLF